MFWLIVCDIEEIGGMFITMNFLLTSKPIFQNSYLQFTTCIWAVWKWIMGLPKWLTSMSHGPRDPWPRLCPGPTMGLAAPSPPASFLGFQVRGTFITVHVVIITYLSKQSFHFAKITSSLFISQVNTQKIPQRIYHINVVVHYYLHHDVPGPGLGPDHIPSRPQAAVQLWAHHQHSTSNQSVHPQPITSLHLRTWPVTIATLYVWLL